MTLKRTLENKLLRIHEICKNSVASGEDAYILLGRIESISDLHEYDDRIYNDKE